MYGNGIPRSDHAELGERVVCALYRENYHSSATRILLISLRGQCNPLNKLAVVRRHSMHLV